MSDDIKVTASASGIVLISGIAQLQIPSQEQSISIAAFNQPTDNSLVNLQNRNVLIQSEGIVPNDELVHRPTSSKRILKRKVEELAVQRYGMCGQGVDFSDVIKEYCCSKPKAQRILKDCCQQGILFTLKRTRPQHYYPSELRADISEKLMQKGTVPIDPTVVNHSSTPLSSSIPTDTDQIIVQTLEGYILPLLPTAPSYIHNIHLKLSIISECYKELRLSTISGNKGKKTTEVPGTSKVDYTFYPNGTVIAEVMCSNHPFRLQTEEDKDRLLGFFGQLQQVLLSILSDSHERIVPNVLEWVVTECDINKDIKVSDWFHWTGLKIQVKHMNHLFSLYIKSMGRDTVYRVEERKHPNQSALDFINDVFNPSQDYTKYTLDPLRGLMKSTC